MIQSIQDAFLLIETDSDNFPIEAIEYLREHPADPLIAEKLSFALGSAYDEDVYYDEEEDYWSNAPFWYTFVAEKHLSEDLIGPVIGLVTDGEDEENMDADLCEQASYLLGLLAQRYPDATIEAVIEAVEAEMDAESDAPYYYLYEAFYFADPEKHGAQLLDLYGNFELAAPELMTYPLLSIQVPGLLPIMWDWVEAFEEESNDNDDPEFLTTFQEFKDIVKGVEDGNYADLLEDAPSWSLTRGDWKEYLEELERLEEEAGGEDDEDWDDEEGDDEYDDRLLSPDEMSHQQGDYAPFEQVPETHLHGEPRADKNAPCPCGSGKLYKDCHWGKD